VGGVVVVVGAVVGVFLSDGVLGARVVGGAAIRGGGGEACQ